MPGDTIPVNNTSDSLKLHPLAQQLVNFPHKNQHSNELYFFVVVAILVFVAAFPFIIYRLRKKYRLQQAYKTASNNFAKYDEWLGAWNGYYKSLPVELRQRFLERVAWFMATKTFTCVNLPMEDKMPLLISSASIQITFGLDKYLLDFFDTIYIMQHNYQYAFYDRPFEGHVNSNGIYLSWDNFLLGYEDYTDANNVGIHEMAHALAYVNFMAGANSGRDKAFITRFYHFSAAARPIFENMQKGQKNLLNEYAATNYNEFWAVAVETFFEKPLHMKLDMPDLYDAISNLLNQDPMLPEKLLGVDIGQPKRG